MERLLAAERHARADIAVLQRATFRHRFADARRGRTLQEHIAALCPAPSPVPALPVPVAAAVAAARAPPRPRPTAWGDERPAAWPEAEQASEQAVDAPGAVEPGKSGGTAEPTVPQVSGPMEPVALSVALPAARDEEPPSAPALPSPKAAPLPEPAAIPALPVEEERVAERPLTRGASAFVRQQREASRARLTAKARAAVEQAEAAARSELLASHGTPAAMLRAFLAGAETIERLALHRRWLEVSAALWHHGLVLAFTAWGHAAFATAGAVSRGEATARCGLIMEERATRRDLLLRCAAGPTEEEREARRRHDAFEAAAAQRRAAEREAAEEEADARHRQVVAQTHRSVAADQRERLVLRRAFKRLRGEACHDEAAARLVLLDEEDAAVGSLVREERTAASVAGFVGDLTTEYASLLRRLLHRHTAAVAEVTALRAEAEEHEAGAWARQLAAIKAASEAAELAAMERRMKARLQAELAEERRIAAANRAYVRCASADARAAREAARVENNDHLHVLQPKVLALRRGLTSAGPRRSAADLPAAAHPPDSPDTPTLPSAEDRPASRLAEMRGRLQAKLACPEGQSPPQPVRRLPTLPTP